MITIKEIRNFLSSRFFIITFSSLCFLTSLFYFLHLGYANIQKRQNTDAFVVFYDLLERYRGALDGNSDIPFDELSLEIKKARNNLGFFSSFGKFFHFLEYQASSFSQADEEKRPNVKISQKLNAKTDPFHFLFLLFSATDKAMSRNNKIKQQGLQEYKMLSDADTPFRDVALFYYGYFLLKTTSLRQADEAWYPLLHDPLFNQSLYKELVLKARNLDF
jgi:hypothetical protein